MSYRYHGYLHTLTKLGASRIDKEIAKGNLTWGEVAAAQGTKTRYKRDDLLRQTMRKEWHSPGPRSASEMKMRGAVAEHAYAKALREGAVTLSDGSRTPIRQGEEFAYHSPGRLWGEGHIEVPKDGPSDMKALQRDTAKSLRIRAEPHQNAVFQNAWLRHEIGEADSHLLDEGLAHSTHLGPRPVLEENMAAYGRPDVSRVIQKIRSGSPDDALVARLQRQVGYHPDRPIPLDGRQHKALNARVTASPHLLAQETREEAAAYAHTGAMPVPKYAPQALHDSVEPKLVKTLFSEGPRAAWDKLRNAASAHTPGGAWDTFTETGRPAAAVPPSARGYARLFTRTPGGRALTGLAAGTAAAAAGGTAAYLGWPSSEE